jgi:endoglucanase
LTTQSSLLSELLKLSSLVTISPGRYYNNIISDVDGFKAWWATTAKLFASNDKVIFDTNNEYHDMDNSLVARLNQAAIDGIRGAGATSQYIFVEGNSWTGAWTWVHTPPTFSSTPFITPCTQPVAAGVPASTRTD